MPKALQYRASSVIYFQGDAGDKIYILQSGKVSLNYQDIETGQDIHDLVQPGEFFGVKSAMGRYPREENALVLQDAAVISFAIPEFEQLAMSNTRIVMKMLKVFSNQLRRIHKQVSNLMKKEEQQSPELGLYMVGEYYLKNRQYAQAKYVFGRYLTYYPAGKLAPQAAQYLDVADGSLARFGDGKGPTPVTSVAAPAATPAATPAAVKPSPAELSSAAKAYYDALSLFSQEKYQAALSSFKKILDVDEDPEYSAKSSFEMGRCYFLLGKFDDCIRHLSDMLTTYPKHPDLCDTLYHLGQAYEKKGETDKAVGFYRKIVSVAVDEDEGVLIKTKKALKALEA